MGLRETPCSPTAGRSFILTAVLALLIPVCSSMGEENRAKIAAFFDGPIRTLRLVVEPPQLEQLKRKPRTYVEATLTDGDQVCKHVAVKLKGRAGSFQPLDRKPGLTLNFHEFEGAKRYHGMRKFHLNNAAQDPTYLNELIAAEIARKAGVPAARCTHALVKLNDRDLGLYVLKEERLYLARVERVWNQVLKPHDWVARVEVAGNKVRDALAVDHPERVKDFEAAVKLTKERVAGRIQGVEKQLAALPAPTPTGEKKD